MHTPAKLVRTWLLAAAIAVVGVAVQVNPAEAARVGGFHAGGGHWHGGGGHWRGGGGHWHGGGGRGNWHGNGGCWNCGGWGWGAAGLATGLALGAGWPYYGYGYGYPYGGYGYGYPYYSAASYGGCHLVRRAYHTSHGTVVRRVRVCS